MNRGLDIHITDTDLLTAYRAHYPIFPIKRIAIAVLFALVVGIGVSLIDGWPGYGRIAIICAAMLVCLALLILAIRLLMRFWWLPRVSRRVYAQQADLHVPFTMSWDADILTTRHANGITNYAWSDFHRWLRRDDVLLIYRSEALFNFVPLRDDATRQVADEIISLLSRAGVEQRKPR